MRPLTTIEIVDAAWLVLRRQGVQLYACSTAGTLPVALLVMSYFVWLGTLVQGTAKETFYGGAVLWGMLMAAAWSLNSVARAAVTAAALAEVRGEPVSWGEAWRQAGRHGATAALVGLAGFAAGWLGGFFFIAPGLLAAAAWWVSRPAALDEERPFVHALRRSRRLTEGYRSKALGLWLVFLLLWITVVLNLYLFAAFLVGTAGAFLGIDTSSLAPLIQPTNQAYTALLFLAAFVLLDPLKTAADAVLYLDLKVRREGADLRERLRALRTTLSRTAVLLLCLSALPARAMPASEYLDRVRTLRQRLEAAKTPAELRETVPGGPVRMPGGELLPVENRALAEGVRTWHTPEEKGAVLRRLEALERSLGGVDAASAAPRQAADADPKPAVRQILQAPEFQPLAERDELRDLVKGLDLSKTKPWWESFVQWLRKVLFKPRPAEPQVPRWNMPDLTTVAYVLLGITLLFVLALLIRWFIERPARAAARTGSAAAPMDASTTENALDHTVDEWEQFARQWLYQGDVRQAVRALYLATLVHLHRERRIDYNRALTNWVYVRQFRGETEQKSILRQLTRVFDDTWYGEHPTTEAEYRMFEQGARALGTPAPVK